MANAIFGFENRVPRGALFTGSQLAGLTVGNLQDQQMSDASSWRTAGALTFATGAWVRCEATAPVPWRVWSLARTNFSPDAMVRFLLSDVQDFTTVIYNSDWRPARIVRGINQVVHVLRAEITARYARFDVDDPNNTDGFLSVGGAYMGPVWQPRLNISPESAISHDRSSIVTTARSGAKYVTPTHFLRGWNIAHDNLDRVDLWSRFWRMDQTSHSGENILFIPDPDSPDVESEAVFGLLEVTSEITHQTRTGAYRAWRGRITERM